MYVCVCVYAHVLVKKSRFNEGLLFIYFCVCVCIYIKSHCLEEMILIVVAVEEDKTVCVCIYIEGTIRHAYPPLFFS